MRADAAVALALAGGVACSRRGQRLAEVPGLGLPDRPRPILTSAIHELNFNAVWHQILLDHGRRQVPKGARHGAGRPGRARHIPHRRRCPRPIRVRSIGTRPSASTFTYRQQPGPENPLGVRQLQQLACRLPARHSVPIAVCQQLPHRKLRLRAGQGHRAASPGCWPIRAGASTCWRSERAASAAMSRCAKPIPLYFVYITAWPSEDGVAQFRRRLPGGRRRPWLPRPIDSARQARAQASRTRLEVFLVA